VAHVAKYTRTQVGGLTRHYERAKSEKTGEYLKFSNQEIDLAKTHLNYNLAPERVGGQLEFIKRRTSEVRCIGRADVKVMCSWVITVPKSLKECEYGLFFEEIYKFLNGRYGQGLDKNVISAYVHVDETTPHMHYSFVPVVWCKKRDIEKVSAKEVLHRFDLQTFHPDLEKHMAAVFGREIGILNEATKDGNRAVEELKRGTARVELGELEDVVSKLRHNAKSLQGDVEYLKGEKEQLEGQIENIKEQIASEEEEYKKLEGKSKTKKGVDNIAQRASTSMFGGSVKLSKEDFDDLVKTALASPVIKTLEKLKAAEKKNEELEPLANKVLLLESQVSEMRRLVSDLREVIRTKDEELHKKDLNIQGITQVRDRNIRDLNSKIRKLERNNEDIKTSSINKINRVLENIDDSAAIQFAREWKAQEQKEHKKHQSRGDEGWER